MLGERPLIRLEDRDSGGRDVPERDSDLKKQIAHHHYRKQWSCVVCFLCCFCFSVRLFETNHRRTIVIYIHVRKSWKRTSGKHVSDVCHSFVSESLDQESFYWGRLSLGQQNRKSATEGGACSDEKLRFPCSLSR